MRRKYIVILSILLIGLLSACGSSSDDKTDLVNEIETAKSDFTGEISAINGHMAVVNASIGRVAVDLSVNSGETFQVGDKVKVGHDGMILESDPAQINTLSVELMD